MSETADAEAKTGELVRFDKNDIVVFNQFKSDLEKLKEDSKKIIPDLTTKKGIEAEKSYIYKIRQSKSALDRARKSEKEESFNYGKEVDSQAAAIRTELEEIIERREAPIKEAEEKEQARSDALEQRMLVFTNYKSSIEHDPNLSSDDLAGLLDVIREVKIDESWGEYEESARMAQQEAVNILQPRIGMKKDQEELAAENARLKQEQIEREQRETQEKADREQQEQQQRETQEKADREKREQEEEEKRVENERTTKHGKNLEVINQYADFSLTMTPLETMESILKIAQEAEIDSDAWEEFADKAQLALLNSIEDLKGLIVQKKQLIADAEELERRRQEDEERQQREDDEKAEQERQEQLAQDEAHQTGFNADAEGKIAEILEDESHGPHNQAHEIVEAIANGDVPHVTINY